MKQKFTKQTLSKYARLLLIAMGLSLFLLLAVSLMRPTAPAYADLPPRPTAVPGSDNLVQGAQIMLVVETAVGNEWTAVQWQDPNTGEWTTVEGWQGTLEANGTQIWWVGTEQFDRGPFRWQLFNEEGGTLLETSDPFTMPGQNREIVTVNIPAVEE